MGSSLNNIVGMERLVFVVLLCAHRATERWFVYSSRAVFQPAFVPSDSCLVLPSFRFLVRFIRWRHFQGLLRFNLAGCVFTASSAIAHVILYEEGFVLVSFGTSC